MTHPHDLARRLTAELLGTALLVTVVVGSGIAAQRLSPDDVGLQLLENSTATFLGLTVLILLFGPVSGAHFNPVVSAADWFLGRRAGTGLSGSDVGLLHGRADPRRHRRRRARQPHVPGPAQRAVHQGPHRRAPAARRGRRHRRAGRADLRARPHRPRHARRTRRRRLHRRRLLVHLLARRSRTPPSPSAASSPTRSPASPPAPSPVSSSPRSSAPRSPSASSPGSTPTSATAPTTSSSRTTPPRPRRRHDPEERPMTTTAEHHRHPAGRLRLRPQRRPFRHQPRPDRALRRRPRPRPLGRHPARRAHPPRGRRRAREARPRHLARRHPSC